MPGRTPTPTSKKILNGNPGKRVINLREPQPELKSPRCPQWLSPEARKEWRRIVPELRKMRVLTMADRNALAAYCAEWAAYVQARDAIDKSSPLIKVKTTRGKGENISVTETVEINPFVIIAQRSLKNAHRLMQEFGITPASRTRVQTIGPEGEKNKMAKFTGGYRKSVNGGT